MPSPFVETVRQVIYPGDCDVMGHLNTRHYTALFDHAVWKLLSQLGIDEPYGAGAKLGWADVESLYKYRREIRAGEAIRICSRIVRVGRSSIVTESIMVGDTDDQERATCRTTSVRFDLTLRRPVEVPELLRVFRDAAGTAGT